MLKRTKDSYTSVSGSSKYEGNVYLMGKPVCDDDWGVDNAKVVCKSLGFSSQTKSHSYQGGKFGKAPAKNYILDNVNCNGYESHLGHCQYYMMHNCGESEVVGVLCLDPASLELKGNLGLVYV